MPRRTPKRARLTNKQSHYVQELRQIFALLDLDFENIRDYPSAEERTAHLERMLTHVIRGEVITQFTLIDELLTYKLARRILGSKRIQLRRSKRFQAIKGALVDSRLSLSRKLALLRQFARVPNHVTSIISSLGGIRNVFAHTFFLDSPAKKLQYRGKSILSFAGLSLFHADTQRVLNYFIDW